MVWLWVNLIGFVVEVGLVGGWMFVMHCSVLVVCGID